MLLQGSLAATRANHSAISLRHQLRFSCSPSHRYCQLSWRV